MRFTKFSEYFDNKKKEKSKPDNLAKDLGLDIATGDKDPYKPVKDNYEKTLADKTKIPTYPKTPEKNINKNLGYDVPKPVKSSPNPYMAGNKQPSSKELDKGLGNVGDKDNVLGFNELTSMDNESFIEATKNLSTKDFINNMVSEHCGCENDVAPHVVSYYAGAGHPDPIQAIQYLVYVMDKNPHILRALVHEARRKGCFGKMCKAMMKFPEFAKISSEPDAEETHHEEYLDNEIEHGEKDHEDVVATIEEPKNAQVQEEDEIEQLQKMKKSKKK